MDFIGFNSAVISDCCSTFTESYKNNKTNKSSEYQFITKAVTLIVEQDGIKGLFWQRVTNTYINERYSRYYFYGLLEIYRKKFF